ncbi:MAG: hypothetical protein AAB645_01900 [Patescibacteria group bacterium]
MKYLTAMVVIIFLTTALFGFFYMDHMGQASNSNCPVAALLSFACTPDALSMAIQHLSAFQSFFSIPLVSSLTLVLLALSIVGFFWIILESILLVRSDYLANQRNFFYLITEFLFKRKFSKWLSLLENSPTYS